MHIRQLSLFLENRPGQLRGPVKALGDASIDILTMSLADTKQFGILRLVVRDSDGAKQVLEKAGYVVTVTDLVALDVADRPGGLAQTLESFERAGLGIEYMYAFTVHDRRGFAPLLFRLEDPAAAAAALKALGERVLDAEEVFRRAGA
jgi:hypothetical protein